MCAKCIDLHREMASPVNEVPVSGVLAAAEVQ
jgi:hypothetical protein